MGREAIFVALRLIFLRLPPTADRQADVVRVGPAFDPNLGAVNPDPLFPQWGSVISAGFIMWCGLHMLLFWQREALCCRGCQSRSSWSTPPLLGGHRTLERRLRVVAQDRLQLDDAHLVAGLWLPAGTEEMLEAWVRVYKLNKARQACRLLMRCLLWVMVLLIYCG